MANALQSYVEKFLLNPGRSQNVDEDGNEIESKLKFVLTKTGW